jgi:hypothetical protein
MTQILESNYKNLLVSGCSFTHNNYETPCTWANSFAVWAGMSITNLAIPGAGNTHIKNSIILWLEQNKPNPDDLLILIMWSGVERIDWITGKDQSKFSDQYPFSYDYTNECELTLGGSWWANTPKTHLTKILKEYSKYQCNQSLSLSSWLAMTDLTNYLNQHGYTYYYTAYQNLWHDGYKSNQWINYGNELEKMNLILPMTKWLFTEPDKFLGNFTKTHGKLWDDGFHPSREGHEHWATEILVPALIEKNVIWKMQ